MHILISVDMEGIAGVVNPADTRPGEAEHERNRHLMTAEANAAVRGVLTHTPEARITVADAHARFRNIVPEELDRHAVLLRGRPRPNGMITGIDGDVDTVAFLGYHGKAGTGRSVLAHTISGDVITDIRCNGRSLGEIGLNTALAAHYRAIPVLAVGDDTVSAEAREVAPGIHTVEVKRAYGAFAAASVHPDEACERIEEALPTALDNRAQVEPLTISAPIEVEVDVRAPAMADAATLIPAIRRETGTTLAYHAPSITTAYDVIQLVVLSASLCG